MGIIYYLVALLPHALSSKFIIHSFEHSICGVNKHTLYQLIVLISQIYKYLVRLSMSVLSFVLPISLFGALEGLRFVIMNFNGYLNFCIFTSAQITNSLKYLNLPLFQVWRSSFCLP